MYRRPRALDHVANGVHKGIGAVDGNRDLLCAVGVYPRHHLHWGALCHVYYSSGLDGEVASPKDGDEAVWVVRTGDSRQPGAGNISPVLTDGPSDLPQLLLH